MGVTNLTKNQPDHVKRIARFAIDAVKAATEILIDEENPDRGYVQIRVGKNTPCYSAAGIASSEWSS